jgi:hypothetical protein
MTKSAVAVAASSLKRALWPKSRVTKIEVELVTRAELLELADLEKSYAEACKEVSDLERRTKAARLSLAQKVLGVESEEQFKKIDPEMLESLMAVREEKGFWQSERKAPPFIFLKTNEGRYPSWKQEFIKVESEAEAEKIVAETPKSYSYRVDVALG